MIGQVNLMNALNRLIQQGDFPRFCIFVGAAGSGKKLLASNVANKLSDIVINVGIKADDIRGMIESAYRLTSTCVYIIADADSMSLAAKNALLKVTEEPPNDAYFIMTLQDENRTLDTIKSRGVIFHMERYTPIEIEDYVGEKFGYDKDIPIYQALCENIGEVEKLHSYNVKDFYSYVKLVVDNIATVSGANSFKIGDRINFKDNTEKYDFKLFLRAFMSVCMDNATWLLEKGSADSLSKMNLYLNWERITSKYLQELGINGINKSATFDCWLLDIREESFK